MPVSFVEGTRQHLISNELLLHQQILAIEEDTTNEDFSNRMFSKEQVPNKLVLVETVPSKEG